jgi:hypothetical protein
MNEKLSRERKPGRTWASALLAATMEVDSICVRAASSAASTSSSGPLILEALARLEREFGQPGEQP